MEIECLFCSARSVTIALRDGGRYHTLKPYRLELNGESRGNVTTVIASLFDLRPETAYRLAVWEGSRAIGSLCFTTARERFTLNVRRFGALGDGVHDDTAAIQAAILCCPPESRVLIPRGTYLVAPLFLKSHLRLELATGAELCLATQRASLPILPGIIESMDETEELFLGTWEGNPLDMYAALLTGVEVEDVHIYGQGLLNGRGERGDWWLAPKERRGAWRGRLLFLCRCADITVQGLRCCNSPSWHIHPYFSQKLNFLNIQISAPPNSPNTDGLNPESCGDVRILGARFAVGDDCIAIKSGKLYMGRKYRRPCERIEIAHCLMENGHGGVTVGSEMAGGVRGVHVHDCLMRRTDRGLRIKTRRGRGKDGVITDICFQNVRMERVSVPLAVNALYDCDPDGHTPYVQSREAVPVDERTPVLGSFLFSGVEAVECGACAGYFLGLPEQKIEEIAIENIRFSFGPDAAMMCPVMADGVEPCQRRGLIMHNVERLICRNVRMEGHAGDCLETHQVNFVDWEGAT